MGGVGATSLMTAEEFVALPEADRERPWNLVNGEVVVNSARRVHGQVANNILFALTVWLRAAPGRGSAESPIDIAIDDRNVYAPDISWYAAERIPGADANAPYPMPDLAVEVRSPSTWRYDVGAKKDGYERHGLPRTVASGHRGPLGARLPPRAGSVGHVRRLARGRHGRAADLSPAARLRPPRRRDLLARLARLERVPRLRKNSSAATARSSAASRSAYAISAPA